MGKKTVVVGMSGGVDSAVSALLLKNQGYDVIGLFMKNWEEKDSQGVCTSEADYRDVVRVCEHIGIPYYAVNFVEEYRNNVFAHFLTELKLGYTPNPDILCNREIKFKVFLEKALSLGADYLATGHYCQNQHGQLLKGVDPNKDQTYFLYTLNSRILDQVLFPIGGMEKSEVRRIAQEHHLPNALKKDSTGICFIGKRNFKAFVSQYIAYQPGNFETLSGTIVGRHDGIAYYTIGQRKGLGIGGPGDAWFVVGKDAKRNVVTIEQGDDHPSLYMDTLTATDISWVAGCPPSPLPFACTAKIRYRQADQPCIIESIECDRLTVRFPEPQRAVTPRQAIVFYQDEVCLGGAMIAPSSI
jgi:tRNA-specific 2-thiouridylase